MLYCQRVCMVYCQRVLSCEYYCFDRDVRRSRNYFALCRTLCRICDKGRRITSAGSRGWSDGDELNLQVTVAEVNKWR